MESYSFDLGRMVFGDLSPLMALEIVLRTAILYGYTLLMFRLFLGKRGVGQLSHFEFVIVIALGAAVGDPMYQIDLPLLQGIIVITVAVLLHKLIITLTNRSDRLETVVEGKPDRLVADGHLDMDGMHRSDISRDELFAHLRQNGVEQLGQVKRAYMEVDGKVSVFLYPPDHVRPGLGILPPVELRQEDADMHSSAIEPNPRIRVCAQCGTPRDGDGGPCPTCQQTDTVPAILTYADVDDPA